LSSAVDSSSSTTGANVAGVKAAYDRAWQPAGNYMETDHAANNITSGHVTVLGNTSGTNTGDSSITDSVSTTSSTTRASATAVKAAYDRSWSTLALGTSGGTALEGDTALLALGTSSSTAHRGDYGTTAYNYSQVGHLPLSGGTVTAEHHNFQNTSGNCNIFVKSSNTGNARLYLGDEADAGAAFIDVDQGTSMTIGNEGAVALTFDTSQNATFAGTIYGEADVYAFYSSDPVLKENKELIDNPLEKICKLGGYSFDWKESAKEYGNHLEGHDYGVMADEIQALFPELVQTRGNGIRAVKYDKLVPLLIEGIKELKQELNMIKGES
jgi:hypothetical protein